MEYLALYRKYRPKKLNEVVGQSEIKKILANSVKNGTITHAYLFSGPRGTGKTTMAKILAKMVNCLEPVDGNACDNCESCLNILDSNDVIEIDAASNNGVDEIRELREKANLVPNSARFKVYIIDEVHMLTTQAFNALLKTLEEPPKHVIFILATTEYYKIPLTITSRCQKFQFTKISNQDIVMKLKEISKNEDISIDDNALEEIAKISDGGMRDSINFLDQLRSFNKEKITIDDVYEVCGDVSNNQMYELLSNINDNNYECITSFFENMNNSGKNYTKFLENVVEFLKDIILLKNNVSYKYIKSDVDTIKKISELYSNDEIFYIVDSINNLMDKLRNVSRQSVVIITTFLIIMNTLAERRNNVENVADSTPTKNNNVDVNNEKYIMAFDFTNSDDATDVDLNDNKDELLQKNDNSGDVVENRIANNNKEIIVNNAFAVADKNVKNNLQKCLTKLGDYLTDKKFKVAAGILVDVKLEVAGNEYIILSVPNEASVKKIYDNYKLCKELLDLVFESEYNFVVLNQDDWNKYRDEYVENFKNGKKYTLMELITEEVIVKDDNKKQTIVDKLFDLVGEDVVEFK